MQQVQDTEELRVIVTAGESRCRFINLAIRAGVHFMYPSRYGPVEIDSVHTSRSSRIHFEPKNGLLIPDQPFDETFVVQLAREPDEWRMLQQELVRVR